TGEIAQVARGLREDGAAQDVEPPPGLAALNTLAERYRASGLAVTVTIDGSRRALPPGGDQAAYRILQEGLLNAPRHGGGAAEGGGVAARKGRSTSGRPCSRST